jgi:hypothetical protein
MHCAEGIALRRTLEHSSIRQARSRAPDGSNFQDMAVSEVLCVGRHRVGAGSIPRVCRVVAHAPVWAHIHPKFIWGEGAVACGAALARGAACPCCVAHR